MDPGKKCGKGNVTGNRDSDYSPAPETMNLSFSGLSYYVRQGLKREPKIILKNLNGEFLSGELTGIIGPSGAGKSSLINVLSGYTTSGTEGRIEVNGRDARLFARRCCYIMQDDMLPPLLTVLEALTLAARLKLGSSLIDNKVEALLRSLGLEGCRHVPNVKLSGGQRKRLSIALELVSDPPVLFLDEPTKGLDSSASKRCMSLLKDIASSGRTVICTVHQPSASLFEMLDHVYAVSGGRCLYSGGTDGLVPYLAREGLHCPRYHNPADYLLEIASGAEHASRLAITADEGRCSDWRTKRGHSVTSPPCRRAYSASFQHQFYILTARNFLNMYRASVGQLTAVDYLAFGLLIGVLFHGIGNDAAFVFDNFSLIFFSVMFNMFTAYSATVSQYPRELPILVREHFNGWYSLKAYFLARTLSGLAVQACSSLLYTCIVYYMSGQPSEWERFIKTVSIILLVAFVAQGFGYLVASAFSVQNASVFGALATAPFVLFSGYFVLVPDSPQALRWLFHVSYFKYALEAIAVAVLGGSRSKMSCSDDYCHFIFPDKFLRQVGMDGAEYWSNFGVLLGIGLALRLAAYCTLGVRIKSMRKCVDLFYFSVFPPTSFYIIHTHARTHTHTHTHTQRGRSSQ